MREVRSEEEKHLELPSMLDPASGFTFTTQTVTVFFVKCDQTALYHQPAQIVNHDTNLSIEAITEIELSAKPI